MSRSYKKNPAGPITCATSEKEEKRIANRRLRRRVQQALFHKKEVMPIMKEIENNWNWPKDGKCWWGWEYLKNQTWRRSVLQK